MDPLLYIRLMKVIPPNSYTVWPEGIPTGYDPETPALYKMMLYRMLFFREYRPCTRSRSSRHSQYQIVLFLTFKGVYQTKRQKLTSLSQQPGRLPSQGGYGRNGSCEVAYACREMAEFKDKFISDTLKRSRFYASVEEAVSISEGLCQSQSKLQRFKRSKDSHYFWRLKTTPASTTHLLKSDIEPPLEPQKPIFE